jgi:hypothetical protein
MSDDDDYVEVSKKEIENVSEESFVVCSIARGDVIGGAAEVMNDLNGYECDIRYFIRLENTNKFILGRKKTISAFFVVTYYRSLHSHS